MKTQKAIDTKNAILEAAGILFAEKSVNKVSVSEITQRAGVAKGTFYVHFESKDDLVWQFVEGQLGGVFNWFDIFQNYGYEQEDIDQIVDFIVGYVNKNIKLLIVIHNCGFFSFLGMKKLEKKYLNKMTLPVEIWLSEGQKQG